MTEAGIAKAAATLAAARRGATIAGLSPPPQTLAEAEAVQLATLSALGARRGGWKLGRNAGHVFSAPMPAGPVDDPDPVLVLPKGTRIELEIALRFREGLPASPLTLEALPDHADLVVLFEFVRTRFTEPTEVTPLERIADCVSNERVVAVTAPGPWSPAILESPPTVRLFQDDVEIARQEGAHSAAPLAPLLAAWQRRCADAAVAIMPGEIVTLGSLTGVLPVPAAGARFVGEIGDLPPVRCLVQPLSELPA